MKVVLSGNDEFVDLYPTHETDGVDIDGCEIPFVYAAYLINLGAQAQRDNSYVDGDDGYEHVGFYDIDPLQVLRQAAEKGE